VRFRKRWVWMLPLFLLVVACSSDHADSGQFALSFRTALLGASGCVFSAEITSDYGDHVFVFGMDCQSKDGQMHLHVKEPDSIADIIATVSEDGTDISFEDVELEFGLLANGQVSPVTVPWLLEQCWRGAYIAWSGADGDTQRITYLRGYDHEELTVDTWFSDGKPIYAEVLIDGVKCISVEILDFQII